MTDFRRVRSSDGIGAQIHEAALSSEKNAMALLPTAWVLNQPKAAKIGTPR